MPPSGLFAGLVDVDEGIAAPDDHSPVETEHLLHGREKTLTSPGIVGDGGDQVLQSEMDRFEFVGGFPNPVALKAACIPRPTSPTTT